MRLLGNSSPVGKSLNYLIVWARTLTDYLMAALIFTIISVVLILMCPLVIILNPVLERYLSGQKPEQHTRAYTAKRHIEIVRQ